MIRLDRNRVTVLAAWEKHVESAFPDLNAFKLKAEVFERLDIDCEARRTGFKKYAPEVLPLKGRKGDRDFKELWKQAKKALAEMCHQKCAYCETRLDAMAEAAVEHFKPKSLFPSLVYEWANYFLGCFGCNGAKSDKWPPGGGSYVRPDDGDPMAQFIFHEDGRVEPVDAKGAAQLTIEDLDLNRDWLCNSRRLYIQKELAILDRIMNKEAIPLDVREQMAQETFGDLLDPKLAYSAALRQCFLRAWKEKFPGPFP